MYFFTIFLCNKKRDYKKTDQAIASSASGGTKLSIDLMNVCLHSLELTRPLAPIRPMAVARSAVAAQPPAKEMAQANPNGSRAPMLKRRRVYQPGVDAAFEHSYAIDTFNA